MTTGFWERVANRRVSRRRAMAGASGAALGAAFLAACGGSDDDSGDGQSRDASGLLYQPAVTTDKGVSGGEWLKVYPSTLVSTNVDPFAPVGINFVVSLFAHSRLFAYKPAEYPNPISSEMVPDTASSFEVAPDGLKVTFKIKPGVKLDPRPPTSSRAVDANDVVFSWNKFSSQAPNRKDLTNSLNEFAPVLRATAPDSQTVVYDLAFPYVPFVPLISYIRYGQIQPREADGGYNPQQEMRGAGPWMMDRWEQDVEIRYSRNPNWHKGQTFLDKFTYLIVPEYAQAYAQFRAGRLMDYAISHDDILPTKRDLPQLNMIQTPQYSRTANVIFFGSKADSPWNDERVRQAASMLIDRDLYLDTIFATKQFTDAGLPADKRWHTHIPAGETEYWKDPKTGDFGAASRNFKHDPATAKQLLTAAGFQTPIAMPWTISVHPNHDKFTEIFSQMMMEGGHFNFTLGRTNNVQTFQDNYIFGNGQFDGITTSTTAIYPDIDGTIMNNYGTAGGYQVMTFTDDRVLSLNKQQRTEPDAAKRKALIQELGHHLSDKMFNIPFPGDVLGFNLAWPQLSNYMALSTHTNHESVEVWPYYWIDKSKESA